MEIWKPIANYEGLYEVSNEGNVRSLNYRHTGKVQVLKLSVNRYGYLQVNLHSKEGKQKTYKVHRLVAQAFIPNPNNLPEVNHKDENKTNNCVENLEWCDRKYNNNYGSRNEKMSKTLSKVLKGRKLSEEHRAKISKAQKGNHNSAKKVICIELNRIFDSATEAADALGCTQANVSFVIKNGHKCRGLTFKYITIIEL